MTSPHQVEFISVNPGDIVNAGQLNRRKIRIQVMKDFRRKERERQGWFFFSRIPFSLNSQ